MLAKPRNPSQQETPMQSRTPLTRKPHRLVALGALVTAAALGLTACGSGFAGGTSTAADGGKLTSSNKPLSVLIAPSGPAEKTAVDSAVAEWSKSSGTKATVIAATDLSQQLAQG